MAWGGRSKRGEWYKLCNIRRIRTGARKESQLLKMPALRCLFSYLFLRLREWVQHLIAIMLDETVRTVDPKGLALVLLVVSIFFLIPTGIVVILRCFVRLKYRLFGIDDGLMLIGWVSLCHS